MRKTQKRKYKILNLTDIKYKILIFYYEISKDF